MSVLCLLNSILIPETLHGMKQRLMHEICTQVSLHSTEPQHSTYTLFIFISRSGFAFHAFRHDLARVTFVSCRVHHFATAALYRRVPGRHHLIPATRLVLHVELLAAAFCRHTWALVLSCREDGLQFTATHHVSVY